MDRSYLFFDIECANIFDGVGKMCSFGYVLTDEDFNVLDTDDVVMNPEAEFDWYLFSPKNTCPLAYSKDYFRAQHNFEAYYKPIKKLMEASGRKVIGFSSSNDVGFLVSDCERYNLPYINFSSWDIANIVDQANECHKGLVDWCEFYKVDVSKLQAHKSQDDAMMTMLLCKAFCEQNGIDMETLLEKHKDIKLSVDKYLEHREIKRHADEVMKQINELFGKKCRAVLSNRLHGDYALGFKPRKDADEALRIANLVYKHGGILRKSLKNSGTLIVEEEVSKESLEQFAKRGLKTISVSELDELLRME